MTAVLFFQNIFALLFKKASWIARPEKRIRFSFLGLSTQAIRAWGGREVMRGRNFYSIPLFVTATWTGCGFIPRLSPWRRSGMHPNSRLPKNSYPEAIRFFLK
jgi:hypothetical protein